MQIIQYMYDLDRIEYIFTVEQLNCLHYYKKKEFKLFRKEDIRIIKKNEIIISITKLLFYLTLFEKDKQISERVL